MNTATATPVEIDTALAEIYGRLNAAEDRLRMVERDLKSARSGRYYVSDDQVARLEEKFADATVAYRKVWDETEPLTAEYSRRPWTRAFLVANANGHVHSGMDCSTCFATTRFAWLPEYSGGTEEDIVEDAGERACTVCYPSAPVEVLARPTKIFSKDEKAAQEAREARAAAKVAKEVKRLEKALLPSGDHLNTRDFGAKYNDRLSTLASAKQWLTNIAEYGWSHPSYPQSAVDAVAQAVAAKTGESVEEVLAAAEKRAAKRK